ncbi:MAG: alkaline phosphatase D family protein [Myxococcota bacterium]
MKDKRLPRRDFLKLGAVAATAGSLPFSLSGCAPTGGGPHDEPTPPPTRPTLNPDEHDNATAVTFSPESVPADETTFSLGVSAGAMRDTSLVLWSHTSDNTPKTLRVWRAGRAAGEVMLAHEETLTPNDGGYLKTRVDGLAPDTRYFYAFFVGGNGAFTARSEIGQVKTAYPDDWKWPITVAATTCTNQQYAPFKALQLTAREELDALIHLGDMVYADGSATIEEYREHWRTTLADPGYRALLPTTGMYITWDDHEFDNNLNPETLSASRMAAAKDAYFESLPNERGEDGRVWTSYRWGHTAELILLDCRTERKPSTLETEQTYLSREQMEWFKQTLKDSPCHFKVVLNSVPMCQMPEPWWALPGDRWQGYTHAREEILQFIEQNGVQNVWFLSGDFHLGFIGRLEREGFRRTMWDVAVGPGGNLGNPLAGLAEQSFENKENIFPEAQFVYGKGRLCMTLLTLDPLRDVVRIKYVDAETEEVLFDRELSRHI